jgi:hypothetical protein
METITPIHIMMKMKNVQMIILSETHGVIPVIGILAIHMNVDFMISMVKKQVNLAVPVSVEKLY